MRVKKIIVNATALKSGGGLVILKQFIQSIDRSCGEYFAFIHESVKGLDVFDNVTYIRTNKTKMLSRIYWDSYGLNKYLVENKISPDLLVSLQNTSIKTSFDCQQIIYLHQAIPFSDIKWSPFKPTEFKFFLYKHFYLYFIFRFLRGKEHFVVQTQWMKNALLKYNRIKDDNISVIQPQIQKIDFGAIEEIDAYYNKQTIFFPAAALNYKNHIEIVNALIEMKIKGLKINKIIVFFTISLEELPKLSNQINAHNLQNNFRFVGKLSYADVLKYYKSVDLVVFPSYLETFGLPLIEAAVFGKPIVAIDLEYARDVLNGYAGVRYAKIKDSSNWASSIIELLQLKQQNFTYTPPQNSGWDIFLKLVKDRLTENVQR